MTPGQLATRLAQAKSIERGGLQLTRAQEQDLRDAFQCNGSILIIRGLEPPLVVVGRFCVASVDSSPSANPLL